MVQLTEATATCMSKGYEPGRDESTSIYRLFDPISPDVKMCSYRRQQLDTHSALLGPTLRTEVVPVLLLPACNRGLSYLIVSLLL